MFGLSLRCRLAAAAVRQNLCWRCCQRARLPRLLSYLRCLLCLETFGAPLLQPGPLQWHLQDLHHLPQGALQVPSQPPALALPLLLRGIQRPSLRAVQLLPPLMLPPQRPAPAPQAAVQQQQMQRRDGQQLAAPRGC